MRDIVLWRTLNFALHSTLFCSLFYAKSREDRTGATKTIEEDKRYAELSSQGETSSAVCLKCGGGGNIELGTRIGGSLNENCSLVTSNFEGDVHPPALQKFFPLPKKNSP